MSKAKKVLESIKKLQERRTPEVHDEQEELLTVEDVYGPTIYSCSTDEEITAIHKAIARKRGEAWGFQD